MPTETNLLNDLEKWLHTGSCENNADKNILVCVDNK